MTDVPERSVPESGARIAVGGVMLLLLVCATALLKVSTDEPMRLFGWGLFLFSLFYIGKLIGDQCDAIDTVRRAEREAAAAQAAPGAREAA